MDYPPDSDGAGRNSSIWAHGACSCASEDEHLAGACLPADSTRFYIGGPVAGGIGRAPVLGKDYVHKRENAGLGKEKNVFANFYERPMNGFYSIVIIIIQISITIEEVRN